MSIAKKIAGKYFLPLALNMALDKYFLKKANKNACIISFQGVRQLNNAVFNNRHIPVSEFEKIIKYLKENYHIVPLSQAFEIHRGKIKNDKKTIALTFDDGYENNFEIALPVLNKYNVPATFYIVTKGLTKDNYLSWPDVIDIIKKHEKEDILVNGLIFKYPGFYNKKLKLDLHNYLKTCGDKAESLAYELLHKHNFHTEEVKKSPELLVLINSKNLEKYIHEPLIEFGSHTHTHPSLEYLDKAIAEKELIHSKEVLETKTGRPVISLAFPDGSYKAETLQIAKEAGYTNLVAVTYKFNENNKDPYLLSRFTISNSTTFESNVLRLAREFDKYGF